MRLPEHFPIASQLVQATKAIGLSPERILHRAGLSPALLAPDHRGVDAAQFFALWHAAQAEAPRPDLALDMGRAMARGPLIPAIRAFAASPDIATGFQRLALFKPLVAPVHVEARRVEAGLRLRWNPIPRETGMPPLLALFELVFHLESCRILTGATIVPVALGLPAPARQNARLHTFFGSCPAVTGQTEMTLSPEDAARPMLFADEEQYRALETRLHSQMVSVTGAALADRVRRVLVDILPSGETSIGAVCGRLAISRRTLQRRLSAEGTSFQAVLDQTRTELSLHYLARPDLSVQEISYLLAFRDPNSFYRAFQGWTGMTPGQARARARP